MKLLNPKWLAALVAASTSLSASALAEVILPTPAEQVALNPRVSMTVVGNYPTSFVNTVLTNVPAGYSVTNGAHVGWCVDSFVGIDAGPSYLPVMYDSYGDLSSIGASSPNWGIVNYIINKRADYAANLNATASEIQDAIWRFIGGNGIGQTLLEAGQIGGFPAPNMAIVALIVADAAPHSDFEPAPGQVTAVVLDLGQTAQRTIIEVLCPSGRLGDYVWRDNNRNGVQDVGEPGIEGVTVILKDSANNVLDVTTTDEDGLYQFTDLYAGSYVIEVDPASPPLLGLLPTTTGAGTPATDSNPNPTTASLPTDTSEDLTYDFGFYAPAAPKGRIGNFVWKDLNANGRQDAGEPGINGVTMTLEDGIGTVLATTVTAGNGAYLFTGLSAGNYVVKLDEDSAALIGLIPTTEIATGTTTANDSNPNPAATTLATDSSEDLTLDFGFIPPGCGCIGNRVWKDLDCDGKQDCNEPGLPGVTVKLYWNGILINTDVTDSCGRYLFWGLWAGCYSVVIDNNQPALAGYIPTKLNGTWSKCYDSNPNPATVCLATHKSCDITIDFGYKVAPSPKHCTFTMGGWGCRPSGSNPGKLLAYRWNDVYPNGCVIGGWRWLKFSSAKSVEWFLPCGGKPAALSGCYTNSTSGHGVLAGQCLALKINVDFSDCGVTKPGLRNCKFKYGKFAGKTVGYLLNLANQCLGGANLPSGISYSDLAEACATVNENYDGGNDGGKLTP